jgi:hypothetical protein
MFGVTPEVIPVPAPDIPIPVMQTPAQKETDFKYLDDLAKDVGYVFYLVPGPLPGMSQAYWGPQTRFGVPQTALNVNLDSWTNVETLNFRYESQKAVLPIVFIQDSVSKAPIPIPIPPVTPFSPPMGLAVMPPQKTEFLSDTSKLNPAVALMKGFARVTETSDVVVGDGTLDVMRYGQPLRARSLVGVRGAGIEFRIEAQRAGSEHARGAVAAVLNDCGFGKERNQSEGALLRKVPRHSDQQRRSADDRPVDGDGAGCLKRHSLYLGDTVLSVRRDPARVCGGPGNRLGCLGGVRAGRFGLSDLDRMLFWDFGGSARARHGYAAGLAIRRDPDCRAEHPDD